MAKIFLSFSAQRLEEWYSPEAISRLESLGELAFNAGDAELDVEEPSSSTPRAASWSTRGRWRLRCARG
jgi:hypothetical protein